MIKSVVTCSFLPRKARPGGESIGPPRRCVEDHNRPGRVTRITGVLRCGAAGGARGSEQRRSANGAVARSDQRGSAENLRGNRAQQTRQRQSRAPSSTRASTTATRQIGGSDDRRRRSKQARKPVSRLATKSLAPLDQCAAVKHHRSPPRI